MSNNFKDLFKSYLKKNIYSGAIVNGEVIDINTKTVTVNVGLKSEGKIPISQFYDDNKNLEIKIGDTVEIVIDAIENGTGETILSREKAKKFRVWNKLEETYKNNKKIVGIIVARVKGGFTVELESIKAFLPGSLLDIRPIHDTNELKNKPLEFKILKMDKKRNNIVVSRKAILEKENNIDKTEILNKIQEGKEIFGVIKNLTDYGAFVDLGGIDGLLHITDMSWKRIKHPSEIVKIGEKIKIKILKYDKTKNRVSLGFKQLGEDPWKNIAKKYPINTKIQGAVTNITDYGCFIEIENGVEGLVHISEMDWTNKNINPNKIVKLNDNVEAIILDIDENRRRISLGIKQCKPNPWSIFAKKYKKGDEIESIIKSITDFGIFIGLDGNIDGLIHLSDVSWKDNNIENLKEYKKGQQIKTIILSIDAERERISLGIKQIEKDPFLLYISNNQKGKIVNGKIIEITEKGIIVDLEKEVYGFIKNSEISSNKDFNIEENLKINTEIEAKIINIDKKNRNIFLSMKEKEMQEQQDAIRKVNKKTKDFNTTLGDLLKPQFKNNNKTNNNNLK